MSKFTRLVLAICLVAIQGCSDRAQSIPPAVLKDGGPVMVSGPPTCQESLVGHSIYHCAACNDVCSSSDADRCVNGVCQCGQQQPCSQGYDCRGGQCVPTDPTGLVCEFDDWCTINEACIEGHCSFVACLPEICDGVDNDCDGIVDNIGDAPLAQFCLGEQGFATYTPLLEPCLLGVRVCENGYWTKCVGDVPPRQENGLLACDGIDNNCDGCIDGAVVNDYCVARTLEQFDVLFLVDTSESMRSRIRQVRSAVALFSSRLSGNPVFQWGVVHIPGADRDGEAILHQDLTDFVTFSNSLLDWIVSGGKEPQWDAVHLSLSGDLGVSWREDSTKIIVLFTDEPGSDVGHSTILESEMEMCTTVIEQGAMLVSVVAVPEDFDDCAYAVFDLPEAENPGSRAPCDLDSDCAEYEVCVAHTCMTPEVVRIAEELDSVITNPCEV